jgi:DNA-binding Lrp family transcriptional regulator
MPTTKLDPIDRKILAELQADGRMTNVELARRVGISAPPCLRRVRTLEEQGYIRGYHADVDPRSLGFEVQVFAMVGSRSRPRPISSPSRTAAAPGRSSANATC